MTCPNKNHEDWKALVDKVGLFQAYEEYIKAGETIPTSKELESIVPTASVDYQLKAFSILDSSKGIEVFNKGQKNNWTLDKILQELQVPKDQQELIKSFNTDSREDILTSLLSDYSYTVEINVTKELKPEHDYIDQATGQWEAGSGLIENTSHYSNLTVPGGTNYTENEIATPAITPSIKGHAQFSTDNGIGWFRSDDRQRVKGTGVYTKEQADRDLKEGKISEFEYEMASESFGIESATETDTKTRRILEVQSDLFQKGRDKKLLTDDTVNVKEYEDNPSMYFPQSEKSIKQNQFLQLLNKDSNWVTFFVKSIVQDSAKKGYEKVLFPSGNTASKVEGHSTLEEFKKQKEDRIKELEKQEPQYAFTTAEASSVFSSKISSIFNDNYNEELRQNAEKYKGKYIVVDRSLGNDGRVYGVNLPEDLKNIELYNTKEEAEKIYKSKGTRQDNEINQLKQELERVETEGFGALKPIYNFYENTVTNTLKKIYGKENIKLITDEYGNTWNEVIPKKESISLSLPDKIHRIEDTFSDILIPGFTAYTQNEVVNFLVEEVLIQINLNKEITFNQAFTNTIYRVEDLVSEGTEQSKIDPIIENIDRFREFVKTKLERLNLLTVKVVDTEEGDEIDADQPNAKFNYWDDNWVFQFDAKANAQRKVKEFLALIPKTIIKDGIYTEQYNYINTVSYMSLDEVYEDLTSILAGTLNTWQAMRTKLEQYVESKPWIYNLLHQIDDYVDIKDNTGKVLIKRDKQQLLNQFVVTFALEKSASKTVLISDDNGVFSAKVIDTDQNANTKLIISSWKDNFNTSGLLTIDSEGNPIPDIEQVKETLAQLDALKDKPTETGKFLKSIGIDVSEGTLKELVGGKVGGKTFIQQFEHNEGLFKLIRQRLAGKDQKGLEPEEVINPTVNNKGVRALAAVEELYSNKVYSNSYINGEGNTVYSYTLGKYLTNQFNRIFDNDAFVDKLAELSFQAPIIDAGHPLFKSWIWELQNNKENFKSIFEIAPFDSTKHEDRRSSAVRINKMYDVDLELTKLQLFQNKGRSIKGTRIANFLFTIPSKTTSYIVTAPAIDVSLSKKGELGKVARDAIYSTVVSELKRINSAAANTAIELTKYKTGSKYFYFFPVLNKETTPEIWNLDDTVKVPTTLVNGVTVESIIRNKIEEIVKQEIADKVAYWDSIGFIKNGQLTYTDKDYKKGLTTTEMAADYIVNNMMFEFNMHQMFIGDPAIYFKSNVASTWDQVGKRLAGQIAPGKALALESTNEKFISVKVKDREGNLSLNYAQLKTRLGDKADAYLNLTGTDAQEYVTLTEKLYVLYRSGEISTEMYEDITARYKKDGDNLVLSEKELDGVMKPDKPVYVENEIDSEQDVLSIDYVKSSSIPLLPQLTKGLELDKIRKAMEKIETPEMPVRLAFDTATKVGTVKSADIFNEDGTVKDDIDFTDYHKVLSRTGFRIQQPVPYHPDEDEVVKATQVTKLLFDALLEVGEFTYEGKEVTGKDLQNVWTDLHAKLFENSKDALNQEILSPDGQLNVAALQKMLYKEAVARNYSPAELASLSLLPDGTFEYPFWAVNGSKKYESIITSLYTNNIVKQKMHGSSYVLVSEEAMQGRSKGIVYTSSYDGHLKPMRVEDGVVKPAQVLMPWRFKGSINKFVKDGVLDITKVPQELLESFGFRIPNQSHSSMAYIEIVGFTPETMGDIVVAPRDFVTQMGSDFDVDKLYIYTHFTKFEEGKLTKNVEDENEKLKNSILDIHLAVLKNEKVFNQVVTPLGNIKDTKSAKKLKKLNTRKTANYLSPDYKKQKYAESVDGKAMVSIEALGNTLNTTLQKTTKENNDHLRLISTKTIKGETVVIPQFISFGVKVGTKVRTLHLGDLSSPFTWKLNSKNTIKAQYLSGAVDNENDPILYYINLNDVTAPVEMAMTQVGYEDDHTNNFIAQPVLREYVDRVRTRRSSVGKITKNVDRVELEAMINSYREKYFETLNENQVKDYKDINLIDNPTTVEELEKNLTDRTVYRDLETLLKFEHIYGFGKALQTIQGGLNVESSGIGKSVLELNRKVDKVNKLFSINNISNVPTLLGTVTNAGLNPTTYSGHLIKNSVINANDTLGDNELFKYNSRAFQTTINQFEEIIGADATDDQVDSLWANLKSYLYAKQFTQEERKDIFFGPNSLTKRVKTYMTKEGKSNPFLIRLNFKTNPGSNKPDLISYAAAKEEFVDEINIYQGLIELLTSNEEQVKQIGEDLVSYFYINGGNQGAREWGKYIHPGFLKSFKNGTFLQGVKDINFSDDSIIGFDETISDFLLQYFQHNPYLIPTTTFEKEGTAIYTEEAIPLINDGKLLYVIGEKREEDGKYIHMPINKLGGTNYLEYSKERFTKSLTNPNFDKPLILIAPSKNAPINDTKTIPTKNYSYLEGDLNTVLDSIKDPKWAGLKEVIKAAGVSVKVIVDGSTPTAGSYNIEGEIIINPNNSADIEKTLMHEAVHAVTVKALLSLDGLTPSQITASNNLRTIHETLRRQVQNGELESIGWSAAEMAEFEGLYNAFKTDVLTEAQEQRLTELRPKYYGLLNIKEFVSEMFTQDAFKEQLNKAAYDGSKSFMDRIWELIEKILNGFTVNSGSSLEAGLHNAITLISDKTTPKKVSFFDTSFKGTIELSDLEYSIKEVIKPTYGKLIEEFKSRIRKIDESISKAYTEGDKVRAQQLRNRKEEVENELKDFEDNQVFETVLNLANKDLETVQKIFDRGAVSTNDINYTLRVIKTWLDARELVLQKGDIKDRNQRYSDIKAVENKASELYDQWDQIARLSLLEAVKKTSGLENLTEEVLNAQDKINALTANLMDISRTGNILLSVMDKWMRTASYKANLEAQEITKETEELIEGIRKNALFKKDSYYTFAQTTKEGELTGDLVRALTAEYYNTRNELREDYLREYNPQIKREKRKEYFKWLRDNHTVIDIRKLYKEDAEGLYQPVANSAYTAHLKKEFDERYDRLIEEQNNKISYYNESLSLQIEATKDDPEGFRKVEEWKAKNNPSIYLKNFLDDVYTVTKVGNKHIDNSGYDFIIKRANKKWEDGKYNSIQKSPELKAFYDHSIKTLNRLYGYLPPNFKNGITNATIPSIQKTLLETYNEEGMAAAITQASEERIDAITVDENEKQVVKLQDPLTNKPERILKVKYLNKLTPEEKSYDLGKVINAFAIEALNYKHKSGVEDSIRLAQSILEQGLETVKTPTGRNMVDRFGDALKVKDGRNLIDQVEYAIDAFYGNRKIVQGVTNKKLYKNKAKSKGALIKKAVETKTYSTEVINLIEKELGQAQLASLLRKGGKLDSTAEQTILAATDAFINANTRYVAVGKVGDNLLKYMQLKGMGWNVFGSTTNVIYGWTANMVHASGGVDFTVDQLMTANKIMLSATGKSLGINNSTARKLNALMTKFDVIKELNEAAYNQTTSSNTVRRGMEKLSPYELQRRGEYFVQGMTMVASMLNTKVTVDGKEISLWEAFDGEGKFKGEDKDKWEWGGDKESGSALFNFKFKLDQINKSIHGNYDPNSPVRIKKGVLGRAAMQFRSWIAEGVANRFEGEKFDLLLNRNRKGRWVTYADLGFVESLKTLVRVGLGKDIGDVADKALVVENMKKNLMEIYQTLTFAAMYLLLQGLDFDDEDDWNKKARNFTLNQILRLQDDIEFYYSPLAVENITQNFVPVFTLIRDADNFRQSVSKGIFDGEWEYQTGKKSGENRVLWTGAKLFPFGSSMASFLNKTENEENFRK